MDIDIRKLKKGTPNSGYLRMHVGLANLLRRIDEFIATGKGDEERLKKDVLSVVHDPKALFLLKPDEKPESKPESKPEKSEPESEQSEPESEQSETVQTEATKDAALNEPENQGENQTENPDKNQTEQSEKSEPIYETVEKPTPKKRKTKKETE